MTHAPGRVAPSLLATVRRGKRRASPNPPERRRWGFFTLSHTLFRLSPLPATAPGRIGPADDWFGVRFAF
jgi:hypothetical protein